VSVTGCFADGAGRLAGMIPRLLGWRPDDFWEATPAELAAILSADETAGGEPLTRSEFDRLVERERHG
jgi:tail assembly chaperone